MIDGRWIGVTLCDTGGQEEYARLRALSYPQTNVFVAVYSIISRTSYENIRSKWIPEIKDHCPNIPFVLVGTHSHLRNDEETLCKVGNPLQRSDGESLAKELGAVQYVECSSLTMEGVKNVFDIAMRAGTTCVEKAAIAERRQKKIEQLQSNLLRVHLCILSCVSSARISIIL